jgi:hypothetical protein
MISISLPVLAVSLLAGLAAADPLASAPRAIGTSFAIRSAHWYDTPSTRPNGGYVLADKVGERGRRPKRWWSPGPHDLDLLLAHRMGLSDERRNYLRAAHRASASWPALPRSRSRRVLLDDRSAGRP